MGEGSNRRLPSLAAAGEGSGGEGALGRAADRAEAEDFQEVTFDREIGVAAQIADELVDRAGRKGDDVAAAGADQMVAMPRRVDDVGGATVGQMNALQHIEGSDDFERAINRRAADVRRAPFEIGDDLLGGERASMRQHV